MIDSLIGIADSKDIAIVAGQQISQLDLPQIRVLKFINQQKARATLLTLPQPCVGP